MIFRLKAYGEVLLHCLCHVPKRHITRFNATQSQFRSLQKKYFLLTSKWPSGSKRTAAWIRVGRTGTGVRNGCSICVSLPSFMTARLFWCERMEIIKTVKEMQERAESLRRAGKTISFVPTMGYFHEGHLNLMREGRKRGDFLAVSIYVNPTQFGPNEDLDRYPRDFERDHRMAADVGVDAIFYPANEEMYPPHYQTYVNVEKVTQNLCGLSRPGHFRGVATICCKLFNIVKPHYAIFGKKDYQQLVVIKQMVRDLNIDLQIIPMPTTREADGLAMSSRNVYLSVEERESALSLSRSLKMAEEMYEAGERNVERIRGAVKNLITSQRFTKIDYVKICDVNTMMDIEGKIDRPAVLALAVFVGKTRLIDNHELGEKVTF